MRFTSNVAGWTQLTQLFDFLSFFGDGMIDICDITFALYTFSHEYLCPKATQFWVAYWGKKERRKSLLLSQYEMLSRLFPIGGLRDLHSSKCKSTVSIGKIKSFLVLELSSYILSVPSFSSLCWPYFSLEFPLFFWPLFAFYNRQNQSFFMDPFSRNNLFHPF